MNIAWIEDDLSHIKKGVKLYVELLDRKNNTKLIKENEFREFYNPNKEFPHSKSLKEWFEKNSLSSLNWFETYASMKERIDDLAKRCVNEWDVVIIDLNLVNFFDQKKYAVKAEVAGFALYVQLLRSGFPCDNIVFFTANANDTDALNVIAKELGIPTPQYLAKESEDELLTAWLSKHLENKELILRRGILDGCSHLLSQLQGKSMNEFRINDCAYDEDGKIEIEALSNWLQIWPKLLPELSGARVSNSYSPFVLTLLSLWDKKAKKIESSNTSMAQSPLAKDKDRGFTVIPYLLTHARNWSAHGKALHDASPEIVSFMFLLAGRGLIKRQPEPDRHEKILLSIFPNQVGYVKEADLNSKRKKLYETVEPLAKEALSNIDPSNERNKKKIDALRKCIERKAFFNELANCYVNHSSKDATENPSKLLMWSLLIDLANSSTNGGKLLPENWRNNNDWLEQLCFSLFAYLSPPKETVQ